MQIFDSIIKTEYRTSIALGFFDGVHLGHAQVIKQAVDNSNDSIKSAVLTFSKSPFTMLTNEKKKLLTTNEEKFRLFEKLGVDYVFCVDFFDIKDMTAEEFVRDILCDKLNASYISTGYNYHFGKGGNADVEVLKSLCEPHGITVHSSAPVLYNNEAISSTRIRECIKNGDIQSANDMLGYNYNIKGKVVQGNHIGTKISTPTINLPLDDNCITPRFGVYASRVIIDNHTFFGATNIGTHPTVGGNEVLCETHLLDFSGDDLYSKKVRIEPLLFIRDEKKFSCIDELKSQIEKDKEDILNFFKK